MKPSKFVLPALFIVATLFDTACQDRLTWSAVEIMIRQGFPDVHQVSTDSLASALSRESNGVPVILDVRTKEEFEISHVQHAVRVDPDNPDFSGLDSLDRSTEIFTYCSVGYRSSGLAEALRERGFTNVKNVMGSIFRWANEDRPLYRESLRVRKVHPYDSIWGVLLNKENRYAVPDPTNE